MENGRKNTTQDKVLLWDALFLWKKPRGAFYVFGEMEPNLPIGLGVRTETFMGYFSTQERRVLNTKDFRPLSQIHDNVCV